MVKIISPLFADEETIILIAHEVSWWKQGSVNDKTNLVFRHLGDLFYFSVVLDPVTMLGKSLAAFLFLVVAEAQADPDRVYRLPGLSEEIDFGFYSGYLNASKGKYLHYVFVEHYDASNVPLVLWLNGGPGCSSLLGFFTEQGPFRVGPGEKLMKNPWAWNRAANMLFIESPPGVGYSYSETANYTTDDDTVSMDNLLALKSFFQRFPEFRTNDFYITGESYAGVYLPTLSVRLLSEPNINYKGFAIGNGYLDQEKLGNSRIYFAYYHGLIDRTEWTQLTQPCCKNSIGDADHCEFVQNPNPNCNTQVNNITERISLYNLNPYNIYDRCDPSTTLRGSSGHQGKSRPTEGRLKAGWKLLKKLGNFQANPEVRSLQGLPCVSNADLKNYLNDRSVRKALNIPTFLPKWSDCNDNILSTYVNIYKSLKKQVLQTLRAGKRGLIYNGDIDMVCDFLGDQWFVEDLGLKAISDYMPWHANNQTAGFVRHFESDLTLVTVRGAGHMVPTDQPEAALVLFKTFLKGHRFT